MIRLKASFDVSGFPLICRNILNSRKHYGMVFEDTGGAFNQYTLDSRWPSCLADIGNIDLANYDVVKMPSVTGLDTVISTDSNDDAAGSTSVVSSWSQTATGTVAPGTDGAFTVTHAVIPNPEPRPSISSLSVDNTTINVGQSVTFTIAATHAQVCSLDFASVFVGGSTQVWKPVRTATYTPYCTGRYGKVKGSPVTVTVLGTNAAAPAASVAAGSYTTAKSVSFTTATAGGVVHVSQDGTSANCSSPVAANPYTLTESAAFSTKTCGVGLIESDVVEYDYNINIPVTQGVVQSASAASYGDPITITLASAPASGDGLVAFVGYGSDAGANTLSVPTGWTLLSHTADGPTSFLNVYKAVSAGSGTYNLSTSAGRLAGVVFAVRGALTGLPVDVLNNAYAADARPGGGTDKSSFTTGAVTPTASGDLVLAAITAAYPAAAAPSGTSLVPVSGWAQTASAPGQIYENVLAAYRKALTSDTSTALAMTFAFETIDTRDDTPENAVTIAIRMQ